MAKRVFCELDPDTGNPIRILRDAKQAAALLASVEGSLFDQNLVIEMYRKAAVGLIRAQVVARAIRGGLIRCEFCGKILTEDTGHMHEVVSRGNGGDISVDNSRFICADCHVGPDGEHGNRRFQSSKL